MRSRAQIIATVGPASGELPTLQTMLKSGMDLARINFSHGTHESNGGYIENIRTAAKAAGVTVPVIMDLSGPRMKTDDGHAFDTEKAEITEKDLNDVDFGISIGIEYIAQSYVGSKADVEVLRGELDKRGAKIPIIAKIERQEAVDDFDNIMSVADAIMIARGDLGLAVPLEEIPFIERDLIMRANAAKKPIIVATQMLLTMTASPVPSRAEVTDVAYAILCGADAVMLSEESALGKYPVEAVAMMERIVKRSETSRENIVSHPL